MNLTIRVVIGALVLTTAGCAARTTVPARSATAQEQQTLFLPPPDSPTLFRSLELRFPAQGNVSSVGPRTYIDIMDLDDVVSRPSQGRWTPFDEALEQVLREDSQRLMDSGVLTDLSIEIVDEPYANGVEGKRVVFLMAERPRSR